MEHSGSWETSAKQNDGWEGRGGEGKTEKESKESPDPSLRDNDLK